MLKLTLIKARKMGLKQISICCNKDNLASSKVILKNNGILQFDGVCELLKRDIQRYVINLGR